MPKVLMYARATILAMALVLQAYAPPALEPAAVSIGSPKKTHPPDPEDVAFFENKIELACASQTLPDRALAVAKSFIGTPYKTGTLDIGTEERLTINLRAVDCWTFMEASLAIALTAEAADPAFDTLQKYVQQLRYWGGTVNGYASRIHYFSGWLLQAEKLGYLRDITRELGGVAFRNNIGYMTARPKKYPRLHDPATFRQMRQVEERLNRHPWHFIPQGSIEKMEHTIREGDLVAITSGKRDLDIAHQGFAVRKNGRVFLLHASSLGRRVLISAQPLAQYVIAQKGQTGIMVARLSANGRPDIEKR
ncbi:MAG: N-acetylmuramoyl-L-alanine amidase-like domain-containing protein [Saprospiraceae bacterium]